MDEFDGLTARLRACRLCNDLPLGPNPLFQLHKNTRILIVGQAPGRLTHAKGRPFDDPSGVRLRQWLGVDSDIFYGDHRIGLFPMGLCFPGTGTSGDLPPRKICAETWRAPVLAALSHIGLTLILGAYAIAWHAPELKDVSVTEAVKRAAENGADRFILPHPSPRNNRWLGRNPWFEAEIVPRIQQRVAKLLASPQGAERIS